MIITQQNDIPKSGWCLQKCYESDGSGECELCGKKHLRWLYKVVHDKHDPIIVGSTCVINITSSAEEYAKLLADMNNARKKAIQRRNFIFSKKWIKSGRLLYRDFRSVIYSDVKYRINIWCNNKNNYQLQIKCYNLYLDTDKNRQQRRKIFTDLNEIKGVAFDFITSGKIEQFFNI